MINVCFKLFLTTYFCFALSNSVFANSIGSPVEGSEQCTQNYSQGYDRSDSPLLFEGGAFISQILSLKYGDQYGITLAVVDCKSLDRGYLSISDYRIKDIDEATNRMERFLSWARIHNKIGDWKALEHESEFFGAKLVSIEILGESATAIPCTCSLLEDLGEN